MTDSFFLIYPFVALTLPYLQSIQTGGGSAVDGNVDTPKFTGRDENNAGINLNFGQGGRKRDEPESLSNREIFERLYRLESDAKDDRFRIQVALGGIVVLIITLAIIAAIWFSGQFADVEGRFARLETRLNGVERQLHRMFPEDFPYSPPFYYGSLTGPDGQVVSTTEQRIEE